MLLQGRDLIGCAQTGTGKTAGFALPILQALHERPRQARPRSCRTLVLAPTRELAGQVGKSFATYGRYVRFRQTLVYGGVGQVPQVNAMRGGVDVLVATPGRLLDLIDQGHIDLSQVEFFVLDEVDRMLDMGFPARCEAHCCAAAGAAAVVVFLGHAGPGHRRTRADHPARSGACQHHARNHHRREDRPAGVLSDARGQAPAVRAIAARPGRRHGAEAHHRVQPHQARREQTGQEPVRRGLWRRCHPRQQVAGAARESARPFQAGPHAGAGGHRCRRPRRGCAGRSAWW